MVDAGDALRSALEPAHELGMAHHPRPEDPHRHFAPDRRLVGAVDLAELARADQRPQLVARHRPGGHPRYRRRQTIDDELGEPRRKALTDELVDEDTGVETDDVEASQ